MDGANFMGALEIGFDTVGVADDVDDEDAPNVDTAARELLVEEGKIAVIGSGSDCMGVSNGSNIYIYIYIYI